MEHSGNTCFHRATGGKHPLSAYRMHYNFSRSRLEWTRRKILVQLEIQCFLTKQWTGEEVILVQDMKV